MPPWILDKMCKIWSHSVENLLQSIMRNNKLFTASAQKNFQIASSLLLVTTIESWEEGGRGTLGENDSINSD